MCRSLQLHVNCTVERHAACLCVCVYTRVCVRVVGAGFARGFHGLHDLHLFCPRHPGVKEWGSYWKPSPPKPTPCLVTWGWPGALAPDALPP